MYSLVCSKKTKQTKKIHSRHSRFYEHGYIPFKKIARCVCISGNTDNYAGILEFLIIQCNVCKVGYIAMPDVGLSSMSLGSLQEGISLLTWAGFKQQISWDYSGLDTLTCPSYQPAYLVINADPRDFYQPKIVPSTLSLTSSKWRPVLQFPLFCSTVFFPPPAVEMKWIIGAVW